MPQKKWKGKAALEGNIVILEVPGGKQARPDDCQAWGPNLACSPLKGNRSADSPYSRIILAHRSVEGGTSWETTSS